MDLARARAIAENTAPSLANISDEELAAYTEEILRDAASWLHPHLTGMISREKAVQVVLERYDLEPE
jgi:hypothetical protein